ncbi:hypothetical protein Tco_0218172 [Tanacetum coccineum]
MLLRKQWIWFVTGVILRILHQMFPILFLCRMMGIIITDWNAKDMDNIIRVLHVFYLASGLKINIHKSNIYGIGVNKDEVLSMASNDGCIAGDIPFNYLGLPIGSNMKSIASWKTLVDRFHMRLSSWKANLLSIGGRLNLHKVCGFGSHSVSTIYRFSELANQSFMTWKRIRAKFFWGGLNIGSLKAFNLALLQKWRWRLLSSPNALWVKVIKAYHGQEEVSIQMVVVDSRYSDFGKIVEFVVNSEGGNRFIDVDYGDCEVYIRASSKGQTFTIREVRASNIGQHVKSVVLKYIRWYVRMMREDDP